MLAFERINAAFAAVSIPRSSADRKLIRGMDECRR
jgi:hypothetical protein